VRIPGLSRFFPTVIPTRATAGVSAATLEIGAPFAGIQSQVRRLRDS